MDTATGCLFGVSGGDLLIFELPGTNLGDELNSIDAWHGPIYNYSLFLHKILKLLISAVTLHILVFLVDIYMGGGCVIIH